MSIRLFVAVAVPEEIKDKIREILRQIRPLFRGVSDIRWVAEENWHFTVSFLGYQPENAVSLIEKSLTGLLPSLNDKIGIEFEKLVYGPNDRPGNMRRMIWLTGTKKTSESLGRLKEVLEKELAANGVRWARHDYGAFNAHLNLARFSPVAIKGLPAIERSLGWRYDAAGLDLMQSHLRRSGAVYEKMFGIDF